MPAIVLLSGGLDSAVNLKQAADQSGVALALTFDYGQRAAPREAAAASLMCQQLGLRHRLLQLPWLAELLPSTPVPHITAAQLGHPSISPDDTARAVWVPNRNGVFVNIAAAFAESLAADTIVAGFNAEEAATFPDNSSHFVSAVNAALLLSVRLPVQLHSFTQDLAKADIVRLGRRINAPLDLLWSCYHGGPDHCWRCESCARLERALREADAWEWFHTHRTLPPGPSLDTYTRGA
jgi:7-cyano-7-deazaguanine synthase